MDKMLEDARLEPVRLVVGGKVYERFLENYVKGMTQLKVKESLVEPRTQAQIYDVECVKTGEVFRVQDWACMCM